MLTKVEVVLQSSNKFGVSAKKLKLLLDQMEALGVSESDLEESFVRSSGSGGQKVNKSSSCVVLIHSKSNIELKVQKSRSQALNRYYARRMLCERLEGKESAKSVEVRKKRKQKLRRKRRSKISKE